MSHRVPVVATGCTTAGIAIAVLALDVVVPALCAIESDTSISRDHLVFPNQKVSLKEYLYGFQGKNPKLDNIPERICRNR